MHPSDLTKRQCAIYSLAWEFYTQAAKAMDHASHAGIQRSRVNNDIDPKIAWAIDYVNCIPQGGHYLIDKVHGEAQMTLSELRRCGPFLRRFYRELSRRKLIGSGHRWLNLVGESEVAI